MMDTQEIKKMIDARMSEIGNITEPVEYVRSLTRFLGAMHPSDAYVIVRDTVVPKKNSKINACKHTDVAAYQEFQNVVMECKRSYDHDNALATNLDVDKAVSKSYGITMRTLRVVMDMEKVRFDKVTTAINRIEERLGLDVTDFHREDDENDTTESEDAQRIEGTADGTGESGEAE